MNGFEFSRIEDRGAGAAAIFHDQNRDQEVAMLERFVRQRILNLRDLGISTLEEERALAALVQ